MIRKGNNGKTQYAESGDSFEYNGASFPRSNLSAETKIYAVPLNAFRQTAAMKDALADTPGTNHLGLGDAGGSLLTGTQTNGGGTATANESASFLFPLPVEYVDGAAVTVRVRARVSAARQVAQTVDVVAKKMGDSGLGSDICTTAAQSLTTSYADYDFTITPTGLVAGDVLQIDTFLATNDTGGNTNGTPTITAVSVLASVKG